jgi:NADPH-dependent curcumin reductase
MMKRTNRQWLLATRPTDFLKPANFLLHEQEVPPLNEGEVLIRLTHLSLDPTNRGWVNEYASYMPPVAIGEVMRGIAVGTIEESLNPRFREGDWVHGLLGWQRYAISNGTGLNLLPRDPSFNAEVFFGLLGHIGMTAYFGLLEIGKPKPGETLVVSAAAGAVGSLTGQIGKIQGLKVVGIAGSDEKCRWITRELGFDAAINYKTEPVPQRLKELCPNGIDIYFENVGGAILEAVLDNINLHARIVLCGLISQYNSPQPVPGPANIGKILTCRARMEGFIVLDYADRGMEAMAALSRWHAEGKIRYRVEVVQGLENAPAALQRLFDGTHNGKLIVSLED